MPHRGGVELERPSMIKMYNATKQKQKPSLKKKKDTNGTDASTTRGQKLKSKKDTEIVEIRELSIHCETPEGNVLEGTSEGRGSTRTSRKEASTNKRGVGVPEPKMCHMADSASTAYHVLRARKRFLGLIGVFRQDKTGQKPPP